MDEVVAVDDNGASGNAGNAGNGGNASSGGNGGRRRRPRCARCDGWLYIEADLTPDGCVEMACVVCGSRLYIDARGGGPGSGSVRAALRRLGYTAATEEMSVREWAERQPLPAERDQTAWRNRGSKYG